MARERYISFAVSEEGLVKLVKDLNTTVNTDNFHELQYGSTLAVRVTGNDELSVTISETQYRILKRDLEFNEVIARYYT